MISFNKNKHFYQSDHLVCLLFLHGVLVEFLFQTHTYLFGGEYMAQWHNAVFSVFSFSQLK